MGLERISWFELEGELAVDFQTANQSVGVSVGLYNSIQIILSKKKISCDLTHCINPKSGYSSKRHSLPNTQSLRSSRSPTNRESRVNGNSPVNTQ